MIELKNTIELYDIWRLRNPRMKRFAFWQNQRTVLFNVDWTFFCFKCFAKIHLQNRDGLASFRIDHSPIFFFALDMIKKDQRGKVYGNLIVLYYQTKNIT